MKKRHYKELGLVNTKAMFAQALKEQFAVPAYNFNNMEQLQAIVTGCARSASPLILQVSGSARKYIGARPCPLPCTWIMAARSNWPRSALTAVFLRS